MRAKLIYIVVLAVVAGIVLYCTYEFAQQFSVLGFVLLAWSAVEGMFYLHDLIIWRNVDTERALQNDNMSVAHVVAWRYIAIAIVIGSALLAVPKAAGAEYPKHVQIFEQWVGVREHSRNRSSIADEANDFCRVPRGSAYCASVLSLVLHRAHVQYPIVRSARARAYVTKQSECLPLRSYGNRSGWILVFTRRGGGHVGVIKSNDGAVATTIEANTSSGKSGSQHDGDGIWQRQRNLRILSSPYNVFRATHITPVYYA